METTVATVESDTRAVADAAANAAVTVAEAPASTTDPLIEDELLVEEISIDGMCGVY